MGVRSYSVLGCARKVRVTRAGVGGKRTVGWPRTEGSMCRRPKESSSAVVVGSAIAEGADGRFRIGLLQGQNVGGIVDVDVSVCTTEEEGKGGGEEEVRDGGRGVYTAVRVGRAVWHETQIEFENKKGTAMPSSIKSNQEICREIISSDVSHRRAVGGVAFPSLFRPLMLLAMRGVLPTFSCTYSRGSTSFTPPRVCVASCACARTPFHAYVSCVFATISLV